MLVPVDAPSLVVKRIGDTPLKVTPELIAFYRKRAHDLRAEDLRSAGIALWSSLAMSAASLVRMVRRLRPVGTHGHHPGTAVIVPLKAE
jgi:hypothetical protein